MDENIKIIVKSIVYCPYKDCLNFNNPGVNIRVLSFKQGRFLCKVCKRTFKFEIENLIYIKENNINIEEIDGLKKFLTYLLEKIKKENKLEHLWLKLINSKDPIIQRTLDFINELTNDLYDEYNKYLKEKYNNKKKVSETFKIWCILNNIKSLKQLPKCKECNKNIVRFENINVGFHQYCKFCARSAKGKKEKQIKTFKEKYGVDWITQNKNVKEKIKCSFQRKYGGYTLESEELKKKVIKSICEKYNVNSIKDFINNITIPKRKITIIEKYNRENTKQINIKNYKNYYNKEFIIKNFQLPDETFDYDKISEYFGISLSTAKKHIKRLGLYKRIYRVSSIENAIYGFLINELNLNNSNILRNSRLPLSGRYEVDLCILDENNNFKLGIEVDGILWHSLGKFPNKSEEYIKRHRQEKKLIALSKGFNLIFIQDIHWDDPIKNEIWKSILRIKLGKASEKYYARNLEIIEIEPKYLEEFFEENHLDGYTYGAKVGICLVDPNNFEIISAMILGKPRYRKDIEWEIFRFATKLNTICIGGLSKILKYFEKKYNPKSIITYADLSVSDGKSYEKIGFVREKFVEPSGVAIKIKVINNLYFEIVDEIPLITFKYKNWKEILKNKLEKFNSKLNLIDNLINNDYYIYFRPGSISFVKYF